ncbi:MAG: sarcosine oxidase subunit delta [Haloechinothrix sp.]
MMQLPCPHCGPRDAAEFAYVDERQARPDPNRSTPQQWRAYLYLRHNRAGWANELWFHRAGCGRYLTVERHTGTNEVRTCSAPKGGG